MLYDIAQLYQRLKTLDYKHFFEIESDFFQCFCSDAETTENPMVNAFLIVSSWFGTSERSGVWTFYEATSPANVEKAVNYLLQVGETELAAVISKGMHDYQNPQYADNFDYPEEWITESEEIDAWISKHYDWLCHWLYDYLIANENKIIKL